MARESSAGFTSLIIIWSVPLNELYTERIAGPREAPVLVFLHHGLGSAGLWRDIPASLARMTQLPALVYDRRGHGRSAPLPSPRSSDYLDCEAAVLEDVLREMGTKDFVLIGHSDGASIALLYAARPGVPSPRGIVSEAAHLFVEQVTRAGIRNAVDAYNAGLREKLARHHGAKTDQLFWDWAGLWLSPGFDGFDIRARMAAVRCPVLALQGEQDEYGTQAQVAAIEAFCSGPVRSVMIPQCGHEPHFQAPEITFEAIVQAISSWL